MRAEAGDARAMFRPALIGLALALVAAGAAAAADYVVVSSTDPAVPKGHQLAQGQRLALGPGQTVTVIHASGRVSVLKGQPGGVVMPGARAANAAENERLQVLRLMVSAAPQQATGRFGRSRSVCAPAEQLVTFEAITDARRAGCAAEADRALEAYVAANAEG